MLCSLGSLYCTYLQIRFNQFIFKSIFGLKQKILVLLMQLPPSLGIIEGLANLRELAPLLDYTYRYAVEVRDISWFQDMAYNFLANNNICLALVYNNSHKVYYFSSISSILRLYRLKSNVGIEGIFIFLISLIYILSVFVVMLSSFTHAQEIQELHQLTKHTSPGQSAYMTVTKTFGYRHHSK